VALKAKLTLIILCVLLGASAWAQGLQDGEKRLGLGTATAQAQTRAYVANFRSNTVSVIDTATSTVIATIPGGIDPAEVAITPVEPEPT